MQVHDLTLYAINMNRWYDSHITLATAKTTLKVHPDVVFKTWRDHVILTIIPAYRREFHVPYEGMSLEEVNKVASELQDHYERHVAEGGGDASKKV